MQFYSGRREFLRFISSQSVALGLAPVVLTQLSGCVSTPKGAFAGLEPTREDDLKLIDGLNYHIIAKRGQTINKKNEIFGDNNDFTCFHPLNATSTEGLLWVNHESVTPEFIHERETDQLTRSINEIVKEQEMVGGSILHIKLVEGRWQHQLSSKYNRRIHGRTKIPFANGVSIQGSQSAVGTLANCAGGYTPWNTFLTSEENYDGFYGEASIVNGKREINYHKKRHNWYKQFPLPPEHYGWIVEVDPLTGKAEKQINLGRAPHEGATVIATRDNRVAVYMGEDREFGYIYKFVSEGANFKKGTLYAANTDQGTWIPLDIEKSPALKKVFKNQLEVLTYAHQAAETVGATPQDRPEDIQVHPQSGHVFVALTKNLQRNNPYGSLLKIEEDGDYDSTRFKASTWISGGAKTGVACPDNLCFDRAGNLWMTNDISEKEIGKGYYKGYGNNGLFYVPMKGPHAGIPIQVASAPTDAEITGPWFAPDSRTLFVSIQHPGARSRSNLMQPTSLWPDGPKELPKSAVVALRGSLLEKLIP